MSLTRWVLTKRGQRIDQRDYQAGLDSPRAATREDMDAFLGGSASPRAWVIKGGGMSFNSGNITIDPMVAMVPIRENGSTQWGQIVTTQAAKTIAIGSDNVVKGIYVRFAMQPSGYSNRAFWNPNATPSPAEYTAPMMTRQQVDWQIAVQETSPGSEWLKLGEVNPSDPGGTFSDQREFFFEDNSLGVIPDDAWGGGNDRNADRITYGIHSLRRFCVATLKVLAEIKGHKWFETLATGGSKSLLALNTDKLERDGSNAVTGVILPATDGATDFGSTSKRWASLFAKTAFKVHEDGGFIFEGAQLGAISVPILSVQESGSDASVSKFIYEAAAIPTRLVCTHAAASGSSIFAWEVPGHIPYGGPVDIEMIGVYIAYSINPDGANASTTIDVQRVPMNGGSTESLFVAPYSLSNTVFALNLIGFHQNKPIDMDVYNYRIVIKITSTGDAESINISALTLLYSATSLRP